jgi:NAD(P)-dependent dehydrogenase (short-subunit alcohol dehydrogenase family)
MEALWFELKPFGIEVSLIEPGFVRTAINQAARFAAKPLAAYEGPRDRALAVIDRSVEKGIAPELVAKAVLSAVQSRNPQLRYRVGADSRWLPRLKNAAPWNFFASGVRRTFELDSTSRMARPAHVSSQQPQR